MALALQWSKWLGDGSILLADKGYDSNAIRTMAEDHKAWANIPPRSNRKGGFSFSAWVYRQRNLVERFFNRIKNFRGDCHPLRQRPAKLPRGRQAPKLPVMRSG